MNIKKIKEAIKLTETNYKLSANKSHRKDMGQFFTPNLVADWMAKWVVEKNPKTILEPSIGFGSLAISVLANSSEVEILGIEKDKILFEKISPELTSVIKLENIDYFELNTDLKFDAVIANPPYVRHHSLDISETKYKDLELIAGRKLSRLTNLYVLFCIDIINRLNEGGRAAIIIPTEWMNANFGTSFKEYLSEKNVLDTVVYVTHDALVFDDALTTASILLLEKNVERKDVAFIFVKDKSFFDKRLNNSFSLFKYKWKELLTVKKWDSLFNRHNLVGNQENLIKLSDVCSSKRGIATGANNFFHINKNKIEFYNISEKSVKKCVGSAANVKGLVFNEKDLNNLIAENEKIFLFDASENPSIGDLEYIKKGEEDKVNKGYLTSSRKCWYIQEKRKPSPIWVGVFNRAKIKFIYNECGAFNLTTFHCLYPKVEFTELQIRALVAILNHQDMAAYVMEQRRVYGGGLVKFEPKDLNDIRIPNIRLLSAEVIKGIAAELTAADEGFRQNKDFLFKFKLADIVNEKDLVTLSTMIQEELTLA